MKFKDGNEAVPTVSGLFFSIILTIFLIGYTWQKVDILINKKDAKVFSTQQISAILDTEVYDTRLGLKIAVSFVDTKSDTPGAKLDKSFGRVVFKRWIWGDDENGVY